MKKMNFINVSLLMIVASVLLDGLIGLADFTLSSILLIVLYFLVWSGKEIKSKAGSIVCDKNWSPYKALPILFTLTILFACISFWGFLHSPLEIIDVGRHQYHALPVGLLFLSFSFFFLYILLIFSCVLYKQKT